MTPQAIGVNDTWTRFMQLSGAARMRNNGFSDAAPRVAATAPRAVSSLQYAAAQARTAVQPVHQWSSSAASSRPVAAAPKTVGGMFDAYA
jgi:hypothetical protein